MDAPAKITGYRSKAINAVRDFAVSAAPLAGAGIAVADTPGGRVVSAAERPSNGVREAWLVVPYLDPGVSESVSIGVRVFIGLVVADGEELAFSGTPSGADERSGLRYADFAASDVADAYLCAEKGDGGGWDFAWKSSAAGEGFRAVAKISCSGGIPTIVQYERGVLDLGGSAIHYGDAEGAEKADSWSIADGTPAILDIGRAKVLVDSRGNVISWNAASGGGEGGDEPADPEAPSAPPPCGNQLNDIPNDNPLDQGSSDGNSGGNSGGATDDDYNPLDHEDEGGFTPLCGDNAS